MFSSRLFVTHKNSSDDGDDYGCNAIYKKSREEENENKFKYLLFTEWRKFLIKWIDLKKAITKTPSVFRDWKFSCRVCKIAVEKKIKILRFEFWRKYWNIFKESKSL